MAGRRWNSCRGCAATANIVWTTGTSSTGWCGSRGPSPTTATVSTCFPAARSGRPTTCSGKRFRGGGGALTRRSCRLPPKAARQMRGLLDGSFLKRTENVLVFGNPGSGKTHLLEAVGQELIRQGHRLWFTTCERLVQE